MRIYIVCVNINFSLSLPFNDVTGIKVSSEMMMVIRLASTIDVKDRCELQTQNANEWND
jgi:hypothetical protein